MNIRKLERADLPFLLEVRNDKSTRIHLENDSIFSLGECEKWYKNLKSNWYIIEVEKEPVGYIRTNEEGDVGIDIHMNYRRRGHATHAYRLFLKDKKIASLWVFSDNEVAVRLYKKIGFELTDTYKKIRDKKYIFMTYKKPRLCSVIALYTGKRPVTRGNDYYTKWYGPQLVKCLTGFHTHIDGGLDYDTIIICNRENNNTLNAAEKILQMYDGKKTKNGKFIVEFRENKGISFGAYNYAYNKFKNEYDYFFFTEDDIIFNATNWYMNLYYRWKELEQDVPNLGFLCAKGIGADIHTGIHCHGGIGLTSKEILDLMINTESEHFNWDGDLYNSNTLKGEMVETRFTSRLVRNFDKALFAYETCMYLKFFDNYCMEVGSPNYIGVPKGAVNPEDFKLDWDRIKKMWVD